MDSTRPETKGLGRAPHVSRSSFRHGSVSEEHDHSLSVSSLTFFSPQFVTSLLFLAAIAALGLTLGEDYGPTEGTPSPTKNPTVFYANPVLFAVTWVNTAAVISSSSAAPGGITPHAL